MSYKEKTLYFYNIDYRFSQKDFFDLIQNYGPAESKSFKHCKGGGWFSKIVMKQQAARDAVYSNRQTLDLGPDAVVLKDAFCIQCYRANKPNHLFYTPCMRNFAPPPNPQSRFNFGRFNEDQNQTQASQNQSQGSQNGQSFYFNPPPVNRNSASYNEPASENKHRKEQEQQEKQEKKPSDTVKSKLVLFYKNNDLLQKKTFILGDAYKKDLIRMELVDYDEKDESYSKTTKIYDGSDENDENKKGMNQLIQMMNKMHIKPVFDKKFDTAPQQRQAKPQKQNQDSNKKNIEFSQTQKKYSTFNPQGNQTKTQKKEDLFKKKQFKYQDQQSNQTTKKRAQENQDDQRYQQNKYQYETSREESESDIKL